MLLDSTPPPLIVSVHVDDPTKVVTFSDEILGEIAPKSDVKHSRHISDRTSKGGDASLAKDKFTCNLDVELFINALGVSFVESLTPCWQLLVGNSY